VRFGIAGRKEDFITGVDVSEEEEDFITGVDVSEEEDFMTGVDVSEEEVRAGFPDGRYQSTTVVEIAIAKADRSVWILEMTEVCFPRKAAPGATLVFNFPI